MAHLHALVVVIGLVACGQLASCKSFGNDNRDKSADWSIFSLVKWESAEYTTFNPSCQLKNTLRVMGAIYGMDNCEHTNGTNAWLDVTAVLQGLCDGQQSCGPTGFQVTNDQMGSDPCFGTVKKLQVVMRCDSVEDL